MFVFTAIGRAFRALRRWAGAYSCRVEVEAIEIGALILLAWIGVFRHKAPVVSVPVALPSNVTRTLVPAETITAKQAPIVARDPADQAQIASLLAQLKAYKVRVDELTVGQASYTASSKLTPVIATPPGEKQIVTLSVPTVSPFHSSDFRIDIKSDDGKTIDYVLHQKFLALGVSGRAKDGSRLSDLKLFEVGPGETRTEIPITINEVTVDQTVNHWIFRLNVQGGIGASTQGATYAVVAQWWKRGRTNAPADLRWALVSPAVLITNGTPSLGVLPVSLNVSTLFKHQPFTNTWVSPLVGVDLTGHVDRVGALFSVTF